MKIGTPLDVSANAAVRLDDIYAVPSGTYLFIQADGPFFLGPNASVSNSTNASRGQKLYAGSYRFKVGVGEQFWAIAPAGATVRIERSAFGGVDFAPLGVSGTWNLAFNEDFSGTSLDTTKWRPYYWWAASPNYYSTNDGNNEQQLYQPAQVTVGNGQLTLRAKVESGTLGTKSYTHKSGIVTTGPGLSNTSQPPLYQDTYGFIEARVKGPAGTGLWPAVWLQRASATANSWPPEIDVFEGRGQEPTKSQFHYHYLDSNGVHQGPGFAFTGPDWTQQFVTYGCHWTPNFIRWYVDGVMQYERTSSQVIISSLPMYLLLNLAVGGNFVGAPTSTSYFPADFVVDYIRWYKESV